MLRPTESATVFLQQLGRGLRWAEGKRVLTVLDFLGQVRREYRYDVRYRALIGGTRHQVERAIEADFPLLPPGCALKLDRIAKESVLRNLRAAVRNARVRLADDLRALGSETRLGGFMEDSGVELEEIYARPGSGQCFTELRRRAGFDQSAVDDALLKAIGRLIHVDDHERIAVWRGILGADRPTRYRGFRGASIASASCCLPFSVAVDSRSTRQIRFWIGSAGLRSCAARSATSWKFSLTAFARSLGRLTLPVKFLWRATPPIPLRRSPQHTAHR